MTHQDADSPRVADHTLAYLRSLDRKLDVVIETSQRQTERLARIERDIGEMRRDLLEVKGDIALLENKLVSNQTEILRILHIMEVEPGDPLMHDT
jgi:hypothetical protein